MTSKAGARARAAKATPTGASTIIASHGRAATSAAPTGAYGGWAIVLLFLLLSTLTGCSQKPGSNMAESIPGGTGGILGSLRPKADPGLVERIKAERAALAAQQNAAQNNATQVDGMGRVLPKVSMEPIAPPAEEVSHSQSMVSPVEQNDAVWSNLNDPANISQASSTQAAVYGGNYGAPSVPTPPAGSLAGGLVPPPPAVTLSTQAQTVAYGAADPNAAPYGMAYMPYGYPYPQQWYPGQPVAPTAAQEMQRPAGSPFGTGGKFSDNKNEDAQSEKSKKAASFVPITPTGMDSRSAYKQRDDVKVLWKGTASTSEVQRWANDDDKIANALSRIDVGLPSEATKGSFSVSPRQVDSFFKPLPLDKRIAPAIKKLQNDLVQSYYRYLYAYNKFALAQQTVTARKQQVEVAASASEQQRAAADLSQAQNEAESAKDDMRSAQYELASVAGAGAARTIIGRVSGVSPSLESLAQAENSSASAAKDKGMLASFGSLFHIGKKGATDAKAAVATKISAPEPAKVAHTEVKKSKKSKEQKQESGADLSPQPKTVAVNEKETSSEPKEASHKSNDGITFALKNVNISNRKSTLTVAIRNAGTNSFSFSPDVVSVSENNRKLSEAAMRADFDATLVEPNQEVKGTITIFGRPWNDKLAVYLSDGGKNIQMKR
jgi:hypothetical protein